MRKIITAVLAAAALALGLAAVPAGASAAATSTTLRYSSHWSGYAALRKGGGAYLNNVSATFTVPSLNCQVTPNADVVQFVAVGVNGQPTDGVGLDEGCSGGSEFVDDFEGFSCGGLTSTNFPILGMNPGDTVQISIVTAFRHSMLISYDDKTIANGNGDLQATCQPTSSRFTLAGAFTSGNAGQNTADFIQVGFRQVQVNNTPLGSNVAEYALKGPSGKVDVKPEALLNGKYTSAFANDWKNPN